MALWAGLEALCKLHQPQFLDTILPCISEPNPIPGCSQVFQGVVDGGVLQQDASQCALSSTQQECLPGVRGSVNVLHFHAVIAMDELSPRRDCALQGASISVSGIKNVSKQQIKTNYVCFPGLCL